MPDAVCHLPMPYAYAVCHMPYAVWLQQQHQQQQHQEKKNKKLKYL
jgi:hypothetical protein